MRKAFFYFLLSGLAFHFLMIITYDLRPNPISQNYIYPLFHQYWRLFVPPPKNNYEVKLILTNGKIESLNDYYVSGFGKNLIFDQESSVLALTNAATVFERNAYALGINNGNSQKDKNFEILNKIAKNMYLNAGGAEGIKGVVLIIKSHNDTLPLRVYYGS
ncbi:MAG: hypothetical protein IPM51_14335 [Sphingobacteriaceae bacterium]|nr:hypothetical protein [Sphingobacteriaceae bacterium]